MSTTELFGTKIKALIERTAARDLYDVQNMIKYNVIQEEEHGLLRKTVIFYLVIGAKQQISLPFNFDNINNFNYNQIRAKLVPVLKKGEHFDFEAAKIIVKDYLSELMTLTNKEILFIRNFNQGVYQPDLLFENDDIIRRIKEHPMAVWRIKRE